MANSLVRLLKHRFPRCTIDFAPIKARGMRQNPVVRSVFETHSRLDKIWKLPSIQLRDCLNWLSAYRDIRRVGYDVGIADYFYTGYLPWCPLGPAMLYICGVKLRLGRFFAPRESDFLHHSIEEGFMHWVDLINRYDRFLGFDEPTKLAPYFEVAGDSESDFSIDGSASVALHAGGGAYQHRRWPVERFAELAEALNRTRSVSIVLIGGPDESEQNSRLLNMIMERVPGIRIRDCSGIPLEKSAQTIKRCAAYVGNDSGPMHLATAMETPVIAIFGPTSPDIVGPHRIAPIHQIAKVELPCQPCSFGGPIRCKLEKHEQFKCLSDITVDDVLKKVERVLDKTVLKV